MLFKTIGLLCGDHQRMLSNNEFCEVTKLQSFKSLRKIANSTMLSKLVIQPDDNTYFTERLIVQSTFISRQFGVLRFFDMSSKRVDKSSFVNSEQRTFLWKYHLHGQTSPIKHSKRRLKILLCLYWENNKLNFIYNFMSLI